MVAVREAAPAEERLPQIEWRVPVLSVQALPFATHRTLNARVGCISVARMRCHPLALPALTGLESSVNLLICRAHSILKYLKDYIHATVVLQRKQQVLKGFGTIA